MSTTAFREVQCDPFVCHLKSCRSVLCATAHPVEALTFEAGSAAGSRSHCLSPQELGEAANMFCMATEGEFHCFVPPPGHLEVFKAEFTAISSQTSPGMKKSQLRWAQRCHAQQMLLFIVCLDSTKKSFAVFCSADTALLSCFCCRNAEPQHLLAVDKGC